MTDVIATGAVQHLTLTVSDIGRSAEFYGRLGFNKVMDFGPKALFSNGSQILVLTPPPDPAQAIADDRFNENRIGLDHVSFNVESKAVMEQAISMFDEQGISHGEIKDLGSDLGLYVLAFRDPDNIQIEFTAPYG